MCMDRERCIMVANSPSIVVGATLRISAQQAPICEVEHEASCESDSSFDASAAFRGEGGRTSLSGLGPMSIDFCRLGRRRSGDGAGELRGEPPGLVGAESSPRAERASIIRCAGSAEAALFLSLLEVAPWSASEASAGVSPSMRIATTALREDCAELQDWFATPRTWPHRMQVRHDARWPHT